MQKTLNIILFVLTGLFASAQENYSVNDFRAPVDFKMALSGTFGELRPNHFHSGIDIKTYGAINKPLHAIADGFVSRVAVSPGGFGKAVYVEHPNGYTSVYAHCNKFADELAQYVKKEQYRQESFQVNLFPERGRFKVKKGDIIAYSGNSGSSMGPHLHFEIRKTIGQIPVNPLQFGFAVKDFIRPKITGMRIYPATSYTHINGKNSVYETPLAGWGPEYRIKNNDTVQLSGEVYFGINTWDRLNDSKNHNGVYSIDLFIDSALVYSHRLDAVPYSESRYVNSLIDYGTYREIKRRYQKTYVEPNNKLSVYQHVENHGIYLFIDEQYHQVKYVVKDFTGNESILSFTVKSTPPAFTDVFSATAKATDRAFFDWKNDNTFSTSDFNILVPAGALYDTMTFQYSEVPADENAYSAIHRIHKDNKPIHKSCEISIRPHHIPESLKQKALIARYDDGELAAAGGSWNGEYLETKIRRFGDYVVAVDTLAPVIKPLNIKDGKKIATQNTIKIKIEDDLTGIDDFRASLNGAWLLMDWDPKNNLLVYYKDEHMKAGKNTFRLEVSDAVKNSAVFNATIIN